MHSSQNPTNSPTCSTNTCSTETEAGAAQQELWGLHRGGAEGTQIPTRSVTPR